MAYKTLENMTGVRIVTAQWEWFI